MCTEIKKLKYILEKSKSPFDRAIVDLIKEYEVKISENEEWKNSTQKIIDDMLRDYSLECEYGPDDVYVEPPLTSMDYIGAISENDSAKFYETILDEELIAIHEMQIIYSFKQIEISLKQFLLLLDPRIDLKSVQRWDAIKNEFKKHNILLGSVAHYSSLNELREVNNALKHSYKISDNVKKLKIKQFNEMEYFTHSSLSEFYKLSLKNRTSFIIQVALLVGNKLNIPNEELNNVNPKSNTYINEDVIF